MESTNQTHMISQHENDPALFHAKTINLAETLIEMEGVFSAACAMADVCGALADEHENAGCPPEGPAHWRRIERAFRVVAVIGMDDTTGRVLDD